jgi:hypothetical protein
MITILATFRRAESVHSMTGRELRGRLNADGTRLEG